mmetsp:Transcript_24527/g.50280  ORF Transcript_24527/g.50280 Transcript_24527/m.50280 type:complete len:258 (-) Transcript_24527:1345-2118(-)
MEDAECFPFQTNTSDPASTMKTPLLMRSVFKSTPPPTCATSSCPPIAPTLYMMITLNSTDSCRLAWLSELNAPPPLPLGQPPTTSSEGCVSAVSSRRSSDFSRKASSQGPKLCANDFPTSTPLIFSCPKISKPESKSHTEASSSGALASLEASSRAVSSFGGSGSACSTRTTLAPLFSAFMRWAISIPRARAVFDALTPTTTNSFPLPPASRTKTPPGGVKLFRESSISLSCFAAAAALREKSWGRSFKFSGRDSAD